MLTRTLIIHAGGGKAGSSALQSALSRAAGPLAAVGITYADTCPVSSAYEITSGNGFRLFERVGSPEWTTDGQAEIHSLLDDKAIGICSSEFLGCLAPKRWALILETAQKAGISVKVVYFVRSAVGYVASCYQQNVKRNGEHRSLADAAPEIAWQHYDDLKSLAAVFNEEQLSVINYDASRDDIGAAFCEAFSELSRARSLLSEVAAVRVNRSLTSAEIEVMRQVNERFGARYSQQLSDRLIYDAPELQVGAFIPATVAQLIEAKFEDASGWINERFFNNGEQALANINIAPADDEGSERPLSVALTWALEALGSRGGDITFIRDRLLSIDWQNAGHSEIPPDFDPIAYLFVNQDVLEAKLAPYSHYIKSGRQEERIYRWPLNLDPSIDSPTAEAIAKLRFEDETALDGTPLWPRLRQLLQVESLLSKFAEREHEYLQLIRKLQEGQGYENGKLLRTTSKILEPLLQTIETARDEVIRQCERRSSEARTFEIANVQAHETTAGELARLAILGDRLITEFSSLGQRQSKFTEMLDAKDTELRNKNTEIEDLKVEISTLKSAIEANKAEIDRIQKMGIIDFLRYRR